MKIKTGKRAFAALIAVVMVLGMFPLAALADGNTVTIDTTEGTGTTYDPVAKSIILKAGISKASADVTVLAIKCDSEITLAELNDLTPAEIANKIAYINQVESDSEGKVNMTFKLRELDGDYVTVAVGGEGVAEPKVCSFSTKRAAATFDVADYYIAGEEIAFNVTDANGWIAATKTVKVDGVVVDSGVVFEGTTMTLGDPLVFDLVDDLGEPVAEKTFALTIETEEHSTISKEIKVVAPTVKVAEGFATTLDKAFADDDAENGNVIVTKPADPANAADLGVTVNWSVLKDGAPSGIDATGATIELERSDAAITYKVIAEAVKAGYKTIAKEYVINVSALGVAGVDVDVTLNFGNYPAAAVAATVEVDGVLATQDATDKAKFTAADLTAGTHTAVVARPGYVTKTIEFTTDENGVITSDAEKITNVALIAGDISGDGNVTATDYNLLKVVFGARKANLADPETWNMAIDFSADDAITATDFNLLKVNFGYRR